MYGDDMYMMGAANALLRRATLVPARRRVSMDNRLARAQSVKTQRTIDVADEVDMPVPGVPGLEAGQQPLGFTTVQFTNASGTVLTATAQPQRPIKGARLVVDIARTGATATGLVSISQFFVGVTNILPSAQPIGAGAFAPGAFQTMLSVPAAGPGITITVQYLVSAAPGVGDTIDIATTLIGPALYG